MKMRIGLLVLAAAVICAGCGKPGVGGLRESFAQQLSSNRAVRDFQAKGDDLLFSGPGVDGGTAKWRVHIDSTAIESTGDPRAPYKGVVKSSWYADDQVIRQGVRDSNLPSELTTTGLAQDCWALWDGNTKKWGW